VNHRLTVTAALASAAASTALVPLLSGGKWFWGGIGAIIIVAAVGTATRHRALRALPALVCLLCALVALMLYLNVLYSASSSFLGLFPTDASLVQLWRSALQGLRDTRTLAPPVPGHPGLELLATAGIGLVAAVTDLVAVRLRRCALAGLPLLVLFSVPIAANAGRSAVENVVLFCLGMAGYLALLSADGRERLRLWGRLVTPWNAHSDEPAEELGSGPSTHALAASGRRIGLTAVVIAMFAPLLIPGLHAHKIFPGPGDGFGGPGDGKGAGAGIVNPLIQMTADLREAKPSVVLKYHTTDTTQDPPYLQVFVLGNLTTTNWTLSPGIKGVPLAGGGGLPPVPALTGKWPTVQTKVRIQPGVTATQSFLPLPYPARQVSISGGWQADPGTLMVYSTSAPLSGLDYTVTSDLVVPLRSRLASSPAGAGDMGAYLTVPQSFRSLTSLAKKITKGATTPYEKAGDLQSWFTSGKFKYSLEVTEPSGAAGLSNFLNVTRRGYCQQFAFAMAVLARLLGIPSRVVVGYTAGTSQGNGNYQVMTSDAHAWPELYFRGLGWLGWEPTPSGTAVGQGTATKPPYSVLPGSQSQGGVSPGGTGAHPGGREGPRPFQPEGGYGRHGIQPPGDVTGGAPGSATGTGSGGSPAVPLIVVAVLLAAALLTPRTARSLTRRRRWMTAHGDAARAHAAWFELLDDLTDYGISHDPGETPRAVARRVAAGQRLAGPARQALDRLAQAEERASYAREPGPAGGLAEDVTAVRGAVSASVTAAARWQARLLPGSAVDRTRHAVAHVLDVFGWVEVAITWMGKQLPRTRPGQG